MCGICGYAGLEDRGLLLGMLSSISHRGPDDSGHFFADNVALGHHRLSIIDLSARGHQPMSSEDGRVWITYNGEIYNYRQLRGELEGEHSFKSDTDTEVIIHAYEKWGPECLNRLNGMFAFAIWDERRKRIFIARDRLGIKPLYYLHNQDRLYFASEMKALLKVKDAEKTLDRESLNYYLMLGYTPSGRSMLSGFSKLPAGHYMLFENKRLSLKRYWELDYLPKREDDDLKERKEEVVSLLEDSVKKRMVSDVPLGLFLSGGVDSTVLLSIASRLSPEPIKTFSIGFKEDSFNELEYSSFAAKFYKSEHTEFILEYDSLYNLMPKIIGSLDEPVCDPSFIPTFMLSKLTREKVTVALGGDGCDELFGGYVTHANLRQAQLYRKLPAFLGKGLLKGFAGMMPVSHDYMSFDYKLKGFMRGAEYPLEVANFIWLGVFTPRQCAQLRKGSVGDYEGMLEKLVQRASFSGGMSLLDRILYLDMKFFLQDDLLPKVDLMSMAHALEVRVPFLDHRLVELVTRYKDDLKIRGSVTKFILKEALSNSVPREILRRKKQGFSVPIAQWLHKDKVRELVFDVFSKERIKSAGIFDHCYIERLLKDHYRRKSNNWKQIWSLLVFELWHESLRKGYN